MHRAILFGLATLLTAAPLGAQQLYAAGIGNRATVYSGDASPVTVTRETTLMPQATSRHGMHEWIVVGAGIGAVAGGVYAVGEVARNDRNLLSDALSPVFISLGLLAGAAAGGVVGGVAYAIAHPAGRLSGSSRRGCHEVGGRSERGSDRECGENQQRCGDEGGPHPGGDRRRVRRRDIGGP